MKKIWPVILSVIVIIIIIAVLTGGRVRETGHIGNFEYMNTANDMSITEVTK